MTPRRLLGAAHLFGGQLYPGHDREGFALGPRFELEDLRDDDDPGEEEVFQAEVFVQRRRSFAVAEKTRRVGRRQDTHRPVSVASRPRRTSG